MCYRKVLLIIVVEEQGLDDHHLVIFLLLHLHVRVQGFQARLDRFQCLGHGDSAALLHGVHHLLEHDGVGVPACHWERPVGVVLHILCHGGFGLFSTLHDGVVVIVGGGQHIVAGKQEDGRKAEQRKVHAVAAGVAAIKDDEYFKEIVGKIIKTRENAKEKLADLGFEFADSQANFIFAKHKNVSAKIIFEKLKEKKIYVRYFNKPRIDNYLRITIGTDDEMDRLFKALEEIVK